MTKLKWQSKIVSLFVLVIAALFLVQVHYLLPLIERRDLEISRVRQSEKAAFIRTKIETVLKRFERRIRGFTRMEVVRRLDLEKVSDIFDSNVEATPLMRYLALVDGAGGILVETGAGLLSDDRLTSNLTDCLAPLEDGRTFISRPICVESSERIVVLVSVPLAENDGAAGGDTGGSGGSAAAGSDGSTGGAARRRGVVIVGGIALDEIVAYVDEVRSDIGSTVFVVDGEGTVFIHSDIDLCSLVGGPLSLSYGDHPLVSTEMPLSEIPPRAGVIESRRFTFSGEETFGTRAVLSTVPWQVVVHAPLADITAGTDVLKRRIIGFNVAISLVVLVPALLLTRRITRRQREIEDALRKSEQKFRTFVENANDVVFEVSPEMRYLYLSPNFLGALGYDVSEVIDRDPLELIHREDRRKLRDSFEHVVTRGARFRDLEYRIRHKQLGYRWFLANGTPICDDRGNVVSVVGIARDITKRKEQEEELVTLLNEKNHLMQEIHHRVKNNLAMIVTLIRIKETELDGRVDLADLRSQINTIRIVHEQLNRTEEVTRINAREYIRDLLKAVFSSFSAQDVELETRVQDITLPTKTAVTLGHIVNEAATNAIKYGFNADEPARFTTTLSVDERAGRLVLGMSNTGNTFPEDIDLENPRTLGLRLLSALVEQLKGTMELVRAPHTSITIRFPAGEAG